MIDWDLAKDWLPIFISAVAAIISLVTLYIAHLRGPNIQLADIGEIISPVYQYIDLNLRTATILVNILFVNGGNRSGILYDYQITGADFLSQVQYDDPQPETILPTVISAGNGLRFKPKIKVLLQRGEDWFGNLKNIDFITVEITYKTSTSFPWNRMKKHKIKVGIEGLKATAGSMY
jgi:hypothetical protein